MIFFLKIAKNLRKIINSPSKIWTSMIQERREAREKIERESMKFTCCEVRNATRRRDAAMVRLYFYEDK